MGNVVLRSVVVRYPALGYPLYRRYWMASLASVGGWQIASMAQAWLVFDLSGSTLDLGILGAATAIPAVALSVFGGVIADRFEKRQVLIYSTWVNAALLFVLALLDFQGVIEVWHVWLIAAGISATSGVDWPTRQSYFPHLIERPALLSAVALNSVLWQSTRMVVPAFGGLLVAWIDTAPVFVLGGVGYLVMLVVLSRMSVRVPGSREGSPLQQMMDGLGFIVRHALFRNLLVLSFCTMFFVTSYIQLMPAFAALLGAEARGFGLLMSATGLGSVAGTVLVGTLKTGRSYGKVLIGAAFAYPVLLYGFAAAAMIQHFQLAVSVAVVSGVFGSVFLILSTTAMQAEVPDELRGRVMGVHGITYSLMPLGALVVGAAATHIGAPLAMMGSLSVFLLVAIGIAFFGASVRALADPEEPSRNAAADDEAADAPPIGVPPISLERNER